MMVDLKKVIGQYPLLLGDRQKMKNVLLDLYTDLEDRPQINLLMTIYDLGITEEIRKSTVDSAFVNRMTTRAATEYSLDVQKAEWAVREWCRTCGFDTKKSAAPIASERSSVQKGKAVSTVEKEVNPQRVSDVREFEIEDGILKKYSGKQKHVIIPDGVTSIEREALYWDWNCKNITIPGSVKHIEKKAFNADELNKIFFLGTQQMWSRLQYACRAEVCCCDTVRHRCPSDSFKCTSIETHYEIDEAMWNAYLEYRDVDDPNIADISVVESIDVRNMKNKSLFLPEKINGERLIYKKTTRFISNSNTFVENVILERGINAPPIGQSYEFNGEFDGHIFDQSFDSLKCIFVPVGMKYVYGKRNIMICYYDAKNRYR